VKRWINEPDQRTGGSLIQMSYVEYETLAEFCLRELGEWDQRTTGSLIQATFY